MAVRIVRRTTVQVSTKPPYITQSFHTEQLGCLGILVHCIPAVLLNALALAIQKCKSLHYISSRGPLHTLAAGVLVAEAAGENVDAAAGGPRCAAPAADGCMPPLLTDDDAG
jgi:hypothetical protein